jgi:hypothetical protein
MKTWITLLTLITSIVSFGQKEFFKNRDKDLSLGVNSNIRLSTGEVGISFIKDYDRYGFNTDVITLSSELGYVNNHFVVAPKVTYSYNYFFIFNGSVSLTNYNYEKNSLLYLKPQIGISVVGSLDLVYGYNIPIIDKNHEFQGSMLTLRGNIFRISKI